MEPPPVPLKRLFCLKWLNLQSRGRTVVQQTAVPTSAFAPKRTEDAMGLTPECDRHKVLHKGKFEIGNSGQSRLKRAARRTM
jgi:hypothetical protein